MLRVILLRPGSTEFDEQRRIKGNLDIPLSEIGNEQVAKSAQDLLELEIDAIFHSPCQASMETAAAVARVLDLRPKKIERLVNLDHGLWQGMRIKDVKEKQPKVYRQWQEQPESVCPPEGETVLEARDRLQVALDKILKKHREGIILLIVPEPMATIARCHLLDDELGDLWKAGIECGGWEILEVETKTVSAR